MRFAILRKILGLTQREIAREVGITQQSWSELEKQTKEIKKKTTLEVLKFRFGINPDFVIGRSLRLFVDHESSLKFFQEKIQREKEVVLTRYELLALVELCRYVWSMPPSSKTSIETRQEFKKALIDSIKHLMLTCDSENRDERYLNNVLALFGKDINEALLVVKELPATIRLVETLAGVLCYLLEICKISEEDEKVLSSFLLPWSYYVGLSYKTIRQGLIPLSSIYFSSFEELFEFEKKNGCKVSELVFERNRVSIRLKEDKLKILFKEKLEINFGISEVFAFFVMLTKAKEVGKFSVLNFSIFQDKSTNFVKLVFSSQEIEERIEIMLSQNEFNNLVELVEEISQDKELMLCLQKLYLNKYGFV
jgi:transcriptional regulator with XRE-family HTH domain